MAITRCPNGHFYDPAQNPTCPWCATMPQSAVNATQRVNVSQPDQTIRAGSSPQPTADGATVRFSPATNRPSPVNSIDEGHTVAIVKKRTGIDPVVGWLVCVDGPDKGRDYRIRAEKNSIGRSSTMDICISGDETIARNDHAFIVYDPKRNVFRVQSGLSRGLVYLNDNEVINSENLNPYDTIELGESTFKFVPFCGEEFQWKREQPKEEA